MVIGIKKYRLVWDIQSSRRYAIDLVLLPDTRWWIIKDAHGSDEGCGEIQKIGFFKVADKVWGKLRADMSGSNAEDGSRPRGVQGIKLDDGEGLMISAEAVAVGTRLICEEVAEMLGGKK